MNIKCAAIRYAGRIYKGNSHAEIGLAMIRDRICTAPFPGGDDQGFATDSGAYVSRSTAMKIALRAGQVVPGNTFHRTELFSEDLKIKTTEEPMSKCKCQNWVRAEHSDWQMKQKHHKNCPDAGRTPRIFYWEDAIDAWCPVPEKVENIVNDELLEPKESIEIKFQRVDLTDEEMANLPIE